MTTLSLSPGQRGFGDPINATIVVQLAVASAVALLLIVAYLSFRTIELTGKSDAWVEHTYEARGGLNDILLAMTGAESDDYRFVLTGADSDWDLRLAALSNVRRVAAQLRTIMGDTPLQHARLQRLDVLIAEREKFGETLRTVRRIEGTTAAARAFQTEGVAQNSNDFRDVVQQMRDEEDRLLAQRAADAKWRLRETKFILILGTSLGLLVTLASGLGVLRDGAKRRLAETALRQSEDQYRTLLNEVQDYAILMLDPEGRIVTWNAGGERIKGYSAKEIVGRNFSCFYPQDDIDRGRPAEILRLAAVNGRHEEQSTHVRKDGSKFIASTAYTALRDEAGALRGFSSITRDISEIKESGAKFLGLLEAAPDAMVVVNEGGEIVLLNLQAEKQLGYRRDELLGQRVSTIVPRGFAERLVADGLRSAADALAQQIGTGIELTARRKDGSEFPIDIMLSPLRSTAGILVTAAIRDISVRKDAEKHLAQMESRYRGLLEAAPDAMVVVNQAGEIVLVNLQTETQFGYRRDELLGQKLSNIIPIGFPERLVADSLRSAADARAQQIGTGIELTARRKDSSEFPIEIMLSPLASADGVLVTAAIRNITARKHGEALLLENVKELGRSNEELQQFAYIASHDLQEPLRMVASYTALLARRYRGKLDTDADDFIAFAVDGASRMQRLIQDLLAYSRVGLKGKELAVTSSEDALRQAIGNLRAAIEGSGARVTHDPLPPVMADEMQLSQLFQNLVGNAIKYRRAGVPNVHITAVPADAKKWTFSVADNGLGIESQYFERIFGVFQRLHKREEFDGTGIGLAICKKIVERHGGTISVESAFGVGSTFRFPLTASSEKPI